MEVIISKEAFQTLLDKIDKLNDKLDDHQAKLKLKEDWVDLQEACVLLKISKRTLQYYRQIGAIPFSQINGKYFFKLADIQKTLDDNYQTLNK